MSHKTISLEFDGYWRDENSASIPNESGVYLVYACTYNTLNDTVDIDRLNYIGESAWARDRIQNHEMRAEWNRRLKTGQELCFSFAPISNPDRERAEAALIFHHKPPVNTEFTDSFPFDDTTVNSSGRCAKITPSFTAKKTVKARAW